MQIIANRPSKIGAVVRKPDQVFDDVEKKQDVRYGIRRLPWKNPKTFTKAELDGKFPKSLRDKGFENMKTDVPEVLKETGYAHNDARIGKLLEKQFYDREKAKKRKAEEGLPEFGKFQAPPPVDMKVLYLTTQSRLIQKQRSWGCAFSK